MRICTLIDKVCLTPHYCNLSNSCFLAEKKSINEEKPIEHREFESGAKRDTSQGKLRFHAALSPFSLEAYVDYLRRHNNQVHRVEENWKLGIPLGSYIASMFRHFHAVWKKHECKECDQELIDALCGTIFNCMGYLHELVKNGERKMVYDYFHNNDRNQKEDKS